MTDHQNPATIQEYRGHYRQGGNTPLPSPSPIQAIMGKTTPPPSLPQMTINEANMDFICRATPHLQMASPLQWRIAEEQQAKEDPINDEIEGLDAEVLLNADTLEEGKPAMLDLEEPPPTLLPPLCNSCTPPTLQHSPPASVQSVASTANPIQQLVQALLTISQNAAPPPPPHLLITNQSRVQAPDTFNSSNPKDL